MSGSLAESGPGRSVLVTGAAGLLGGWLCRRLAATGVRVAGLDIDWARGSILGPTDDAIARIDGDVRDRSTMDRALAEHEVDTVIHLAAQAFVGVANEHPVDTFEHILGTWVTLESCRARPEVTRVVVASSDKAYGDHGGRPYVETMALLGRHPYATSKTCTDVLAQTYAASYGLPVAITRCGDMYGGGDTEWSRLVPGTIRSILRGESPVIRSDGRSVRDYFFVEGAVSGVIAVADKASEYPGEAFNLGADEPHTVLALVERIAALMDGSHPGAPEIRSETVNELLEQRVDATKARDLLGWVPRYSLDDGLAQTIEWYRTHMDTDP